MVNAFGKSELVKAACRIKGLDPVLVIDVRITDNDIYLVTEALGEIRVEVSALPAGISLAVELVQPPEPVHAEQPLEPLFIRDVPSNTLAALVKGGYTTLGHVSQAFDKELLEVEGVGQAMLKRIRAATE